jgi:CRISPR-associated endonuclease/helicase Cas3
MMTEAAITSLTEDHFPAFFAEVHGWAPFPWQRALLHRVLEHGWPELIDVPTGLGKTAVLDVAVFASALRCEHARRRVFLVVDRRLIVDQAHEHAARIQQALGNAAPGTACHAVARRLAADGDDGPVLDVTRMRGGVSWSWLWLERPDRHAIVTGTVDQVGSRLLFRGYGVGERLRPVDAALAGTDSLIIVDEAHLSDAFLATLRDIGQLETAGTAPAPLVVAMSASPGDHAADTHRIGTADEQDPVAGQRLTAPKRLHLVTVTAARDTAASATADALASLAREIGGPGQVTGVVANTVAMARAVFGRLQADPGDPAGPGQPSCVLLTGRIRPVDREYLLHTWYPRIRAGAGRDDRRELYVVATQTIEVGADIDLDTLVTESASLPALIQRLGRVNRRGEHAGAIAVVVHCDGLYDGVYGAARQQTWQWLTSLAAPVWHRSGRSPADLGPGIDASPAALRRRVQGIPASQKEDMSGPRPYAPLVSAIALDTWARTSPVPHPDVPVAPYLHGIGAGEPTVSLAWRADVHGDDPEQWRGSAERLPPSADEAIELPVSAVRRWLASPPAAAGPGGRQAPAAAREARTSEPALADIESQAAPGPDEEGAGAGPLAGAVRQALRYLAAGDSEAVMPREVQPGDLLIVPARWGGCDRYGWNPGSADPVTDVADLTGGRRRAAAVRVGRVLASAISAVGPGLTEPVEQLIAQISADIEEDEADIAAYRAMLGQILPPPATRGDADALPHERVLSRLARSARLTVLDGIAAGDGVIALLTAAGAAWNDDASAAGSSANGDAQPMGLAAHQAAVRDRAGQFARNLGLPDPVVRAVMLAAACHDEGKRDPRFQVMLNGGDRWQAMTVGALLAKSGMDPGDRTAFRLAQQRSGYPAAMRHEALSARIAALLLAHGTGQADPGIANHDAAGPGEADTGGPPTADSTADGVDQDLVIHLVASHHGYGRPLLPAVADPEPVTVEVTLDGGATESLNSADTVDWDGPGRFARLCTDYGRWGLPLLEAIVRLADIWCSARSEESS